MYYCRIIVIWCLIWVFFSCEETKNNRTIPQPNLSLAAAPSAVNLTDFLSTSNGNFLLVDLGRIYDIQIVDSVAYTASDTYISRIPIDSEASELTPVTFESFVKGTSVAVSGQNALFADSQGGVKSIALESSQYVLKSAVNCKNAKELLLNGSKIYVADYGGGLRVIDATDLDSLQNEHLVTTEFTVESAQSVAIHGTYAYVANNSDFVKVGVPAFSVFDLSTTPPKLIREIDGKNDYFFSSSMRYAYDIELKEYDSSVFMFVAGGPSGLAIFKVPHSANPDVTPELLQVVTGITAFSLSQAGSNLYVADRFWGFSVFNIESPTDPVWSHRFQYQSNIGGEFFHVTEGNDYVGASFGYILDGIWTPSLALIKKTDLGID